MYSLYRCALIDSLTRHKAIQEHIKSLDFQDCKVCIYNVDSQGSEDNIVIQVIGETSNKGEEPKKFVQTFVLAKQPSGYFVLNDILRYIKEVPEEEPEEAAQTTQNEASEVPVAEEAAEPEVVSEETPIKEPETAEVTTADVDLKSEDSSTPATEAPTPAVVEAPIAETVAETPAPVDDDKSESTPDPEKVAQDIAEEEAKKPEEPKDPNPTPAVPTVRPAAPAAPVAAEPEKPKEPPKPMTWASRAAAAAGPLRPVVPIPKTATPPAPAQVRPPALAAPQPTPAPVAESTLTSAPAKDQGSEWQTAETKRQNRPQSVSGNLTEKDGTMAYIKYVTDKVRDEDLKSTLAGFGELAYFDINRQKVCLCLFSTP